MYKSDGWMKIHMRPVLHLNGGDEDKFSRDTSLTYADMSRDYLGNHEHTNIVDHYYYPDSDLETIQEESSVLDSEDDRSVHRDFRKSSNSTVTSSRFSYDSDAIIRNSESDQSHSSLSSSSTPRRMSDRSPSDKEGSKISSEEQEAKLRCSSNGFHNSSSYISYNGLDEGVPPDDKVASSVDPMSQQKIVYAKCLSPKSEPQDHSLLESSKHNNIDVTMTDMFEAAGTGNITALESFSASELCATVDEKGNTTLHVAAGHGHLLCVKKLVSVFTPQMITIPNDDLMTPTAMAIKNGHSSCVEWLLRHTSAREELTISKQTSSIDGSSTRPPAAHVAARFNRNKILDWICEEMSRDKIAIDAADHCSNTPVHVAARYGHLTCIQTLVSRGASVTVLNSEGDTPGQAAQKHGHETTVGYLVVVETCVSLAQQLVALRNDMDGLKSENEKLRNDFVAKVASRSKSEVEKMTSSKERSDVTANTNEESRIPSGLQAEQEHNQPRRVLQEQPPPPKIWASTKHQTNPKPNGKIKSSIKGHAPVLNVAKRRQQSKDLQQRINAALNGPGISIDDIDGETKDVENKEEKNTIKSPSAGKGETAADLNAEVELITKDINVHKQRKPWEKLTMDEMLKMVRDIRYQPSPSISMCTEDSTMEPVEVMRERMAAASHWFLVEKGREKPKHPQRQMKMHDNFRSDRKIQNNLSYKNPASSRSVPIRVTAKKIEMVKPSNSASLQNAIQQHYGANEASHQRHFLSQENVTSPDFETKNVSLSRDNSESAQTGTLKFMVSHSKPSLYTSTSGRKLPQPRKSSPSNQSQNNSTNQTPEGTPPTTPTASPTTPTSSTQRNNSYRRAIQLPKNSSDVIMSSDSQSSGSPTNATRNNLSDNRVNKNNEPKRGAREQRNFPTSDHLAGSRGRDPLQKRTGKDAKFFPTFAPPQSANLFPSSTDLRPLHTLGVKGHTNEKVMKPSHITHKPRPSNGSRPQNHPPRYFNTWSLPSNHKHLGAYKETGVGGRYDDDEDAEVAQFSEVPELKTEISSGQNSFLRKVQGRLK